MAASMLDTGALTELLMGRLAVAVAADPSVTAGKEPPIGDNVAPAAGGWLNGQPGSGVFVPYLVIASGASSPRALTVDGIVPAFGTGFSLRSHGGSRTQADWIALVGRNAVKDLKGLRFGDPAWKVINVEWVGLGPMLRNDATAPPTWSISDTFTLVVDG